MKEPPRIYDIEMLVPEVRDKAISMLRLLRERGFDPIVFETLRSQARQNWLYGVGRTHDLKRKPVTWTLRSKHRQRRALDVISASTGWRDPGFFIALRKAAEDVGLRVLKSEQCHVEG